MTKQETAPPTTGIQDYNIVGLAMTRGMVNAADKTVSSFLRHIVSDAITWPSDKEEFRKAKLDTDKGLEEIELQLKKVASNIRQSRNEINQLKPVEARSE